MISLSDISLQYGERYLFKEIAATIGAKDRIGLVGSNGAGKSTLLKLLNGDEQCDSGIIDKAKYVSIGYLPQDGIDLHGRSLFKEVESSFENVVELRSKVDDASNRLQELDAQSEEYAETLELIAVWELELDDLDAAKLPSKIEAVLGGLGFAASDRLRDTAEFSGGWQMRIALAKLLLQNPSLLLLDEPTNHLDLSSQRWLEKFLKSYQGALLVVSHDRAFLDEICGRIFELTLGKLNAYTGNYASYEKQSSERKLQQQKAYKNQQKQIQRTERFIERFRYKASKARQAQSRIKTLDKLERIEIEEEEDSIAFSFPPPPRSSQIVMQVEGLCKAYGSIEVFRGANLKIERGDRIAVVGDNGAGKTTLAKILAGVETFQSGERILGQNTSLAYFAQHQADELDASADVFSTLESVGAGANETQLRSILGAFLFHGDDVFKKVSVLSGGERNRLALAKILIQSANFLILDEPTNHLDMRSQAALQRALKEYEGSYLIVSHNRSFLDPIVNKALEIRKDGISLFPGNVSDYLRHVEMLDSPQATTTNEKNTATSKSSSNPKERRQRRAKINAAMAPWKARVKELEASVVAWEERQAELESKMADPSFFKNGAGTKESVDEHLALKEKIEAAYAEWESLEAKIAAKQAELEEE